MKQVHLEFDAVSYAAVTALRLLRPTIYGLLFTAGMYHASNFALHTYLVPRGQLSKPGLATASDLRLTCGFCRGRRLIEPAEVSVVTELTLAEPFAIVHAVS